jgi:ABC-type lipoprotein release transport system permease subunit
MGLGTAELAAIPVIQALIYAIFGSVLTCLLFVAGAAGINSMFADRLPEGAQVAVLEPSHFVLVTLVICVISTASSAAAARIAATADPAIIIRSGES